MQTVLRRAGGAILRLFAFVAAVSGIYASTARADFVGTFPRKTVMASWYGQEFSGRRTANGERFDPQGLTAAHKTLPLGTLLLVSNPRNGKAVLVRVTDRGPYVKGRNLDLSQRTAQVLGIESAGVAPVRYYVFPQ